MDEDRKRVEEALRRSESRLDAFLRSLDDIAFEVDHAGVYLDVWTRDESLLFRPKEEFLGKRAIDVFDTELGRSLHELALRVAATGTAETIEYALSLESGERFFSAVLTPIDGGGARPRTVACLVRDETERRRVQLEREVLIRKLEEKNAELEQYGYTVSHDLRSPLLTIKGYLSFLVKSASAGKLDEVRQYAAEIDAAVARMTTLIEELLELSRAGRVVKDAETLALGDLAREAAAALASSIEERGIEVTVPPDLPAVRGDRLRLVQVFQNLLENAIKFMGETAAPRIEIGARVTREEVVCSVADNGIGLEPRHHDKIFGLFDKVDSRGGGSGVGLALVKRIIDVHGGRVWVQSPGPGRGASFFFTLPRPDKQAEKDG
jgi:signal transduction histidine kinase